MISGIPKRLKIRKNKKDFLSFSLDAIQQAWQVQYISQAAMIINMITNMSVVYFKIFIRDLLLTIVII